MAFSAEEFGRISLHVTQRSGVSDWVSQWLAQSVTVVSVTVSVSGPWLWVWLWLWMTHYLTSVEWLRQSPSIALRVRVSHRRGWLVRDCEFGGDYSLDIVYRYSINNDNLTRVTVSQTLMFTRPVSALREWVSVSQSLGLGVSLHVCVTLHTHSHTRSQSFFSLLTNSISQ